MNKTGIEYLDWTWNPTSGCSKISSGCKHCWAEKMAFRLKGRAGYPRKDPFFPTFHKDRLKEPLNVRKPSVIGVSFMGDLFHAGKNDLLE
jgi:protein gp37